MLRLLKVAAITLITCITIIYGIGFFMGYLQEKNEKYCLETFHKTGICPNDKCRIFEAWAEAGSAGTLCLIKE